MTDAVLSTKVLFRGWITLLMLRLRLSGEEHDRTLVEHPSGSALLAFDPSRRVAMVVRQSRFAPLYLGLPRLAEPVSGMAEAETAEATARRETLEEVGIAIGAVEAVSHVWMTPSTTTERVHLFLGEYTSDDRIGAGGGAAGEVEEIDAREETLASLWVGIESGSVTDAKLFMLLHALRTRRPELFRID